jgi:cell division protein FtsQ
METMPISAPADKRFKRAHLRPARRHGRTRPLAVRLVRWAIALAVLGYGAHRAAGLVADAGSLRVTHLVVHGNLHLSNGEIAALLAGLHGQPILYANLGDWRARLLNSPWVAEASLRKALPSTVDVTITEREPLGIGRFGDGLYLVDDRGTIIDDYGPNYAELDLPIIDGLAGPVGQNSLEADAARVELAARLLRATQARKLGRRISQVDVSDARNAVVMLDGDPALIRLGNDRFLERLESYLELAPALRDRIPAIDYVDLRFDERVYVGPAAPQAAASPGAGRPAANVGVSGRVPKGGRRPDEG